jgi:3'(2'), 5'-bisphosphate nucleotidase
MMTAPASEIVLEVLERLAIEASRVVLDVFNAGADVTYKADSSPVTEADQRSEVIILEGLRAAFPQIPCVAEEEVAAGHLPGDLGGFFFLVDPLDGTKEFIKRNPDFTVNIALVRNGTPEIGAVLAPARHTLYLGSPGKAEAVTLTDGFQVDTRRPIATRQARVPPTIVASRSHMSPETEDFIKRFEAAELVSIGSSLKFCLIAAGEADLYPRFGRTMEWDTAAGDAVLRAAGGITETVDGKPLAYGKRRQANDSDFANPFFIARSRSAPLG